ncbi:MAG: Sensor histidine kinase RcsC [Anaerolineae bacterium]|nr:Sensor histidine kinase RcsC [Anaerolineae bacterium]
MTTKLVGFLLMVSVLPLLILGVISYNTSRSVIEENVSDFMLTLMVEEKDYLELLLDSVESLVANLSGVEGIRNVLVATIDPNDTYTRLATSAQIGYILNGYLNLNGLVSIDIFTLTGAHYHVGDTLNVQDIDQAVLDRIFAQAAESDKLVLWAGVEDNVNINSAHKKVVTAAKLFKVIDPDALQERAVALLLVNYSTDSLYQHFSQLDLRVTGAYMLIIDSQNRLIYHPNKQFIGSRLSPEFVSHLAGPEGSFVTNVDGQEMLATYSRSTMSDWVLIGLVPVANLSSSANIISNVTLIVLFSSFAFIALAALFVSKTTVAPIKNITELFKQIQAGAFSGQVRLPEDRTDEIGELMRWFNTFLDSLAAQKETEQALILAKETAEQANQAKSAFLATMSHELRTPLNGILGYTQILERDPDLTQHHRDGLQIIRQSGDHLLTLINDVLDLAKIETGKMDLQSAPFHLPSFLHSLGDIIQVWASQKKIDFVLETSAPNGRFPTYVTGDEKRLRQVLINLLGNAVKFTEQGQVILRVRGTKLNHAGQVQRLRFEVEDTGIGIPADQLEAIFDSFYQLGNYKTKVTGTGLGLPICRRLVTLMAGQLQVKSRLNQGSMFWFEIPLPEIALTGKESTGHSHQQIVGVENRPPPKILIVDDLPENRVVLTEMLALLGFSVREAGGAAEALTIAGQFQPDAVLVDLVLPEIDGFELIHRLRQTPSLQNVKIIANSASVYQSYAEKSLAVGSDAFLPKPIQLDDLLDVLQQQLALTWILQDENAGQTAAAGSAGIAVSLPGEIINRLLELVRIGDIRALYRQLELIQQNTVAREQAEHLLDLAQSFELDDLAATLQEMKARVETENVR